MKMEKIENRIAILAYLPEDISLAIKGVKESLGVSYPNHETQTPHITLYSCKFSELKFLNLIEEIKSLHLRSFSLNLEKIKVEKNSKASDNLFTSIGFHDETPLRELHEKIWPVANQLRGDLVREKDAERFRAGIYDQKKFDLIKKYGYEYVGENFKPHITLGEIKKGEEEKLDGLRRSLDSLEGKEVKINKISILLSTRQIPSEVKVKESVVVEIDLA